MNKEVIVEAGIEGGSIALYAYKAANGNWVFWSSRDESTMEGLLSEEDASGLVFKSESPTVTEWDAALKLLSRYRWQCFYPMEVHPEFADRVWEEILKVDPDDNRCLEDWAELCGKSL